MPILIVVLSLTFFSCTSFDEDANSLSYEDQAELSYNYKLLESYFYKPERLKSYESYKNMEVDAMYASLEDYLKGGRYTRYYTPEQAESMLNTITNSDIYYSFGFLREAKNDTLRVSAVFPNSPANDAGLKKGDKLLTANRKFITGQNIPDLTRRDDVFDETTVFEVKRGDVVLALYPMTKETVVSPTVFLDTIGGIPKISITEFMTVTNDPDGTYQEFKNVLKELENAGTEIAIIDLRGNPGGSIEHCTKMAAELLPEYEVMLYDEVHFSDNGVPTVTEESYLGSRFPDVVGYGIDIKWIILQDSGSASCSERFVAAVKNVRRDDITIIGDRSYGKGIGQTYIQTLLKGLASITCLKTFYPDGTTFHEIGILPDIYEDPDSPDIYARALEVAQGYSGILAKRSSHFNFEEPPRYYSSKKDLGMYLLH